MFNKGLSFVLPYCNFNILGLSRSVIELLSLDGYECFLQLVSCVLKNISGGLGSQQDVPPS